MVRIFFYSVLLMSLSACSLDLKKVTDALTEIPSEDAIQYSCPTGYVYVPPSASETPPGFCVAKYEMKDVADVATSQAGGAPWGNIDRDDAITACQALGSDYDLISTAQWNKIAVNITETTANWSSGAVTSGALNRGHFDNSYGSLLEAGGDDHPCYGYDFDSSGAADSQASLDAVCSPSLWHENRRTHQLSNGEVLWDFAGNSWEWNKEDFTDPGASSNDYIADLVGLGGSFATLFAPSSSLVCASPNSNEYCGMGFAWINGPGGAIARGGSLYNGTDTGVFAVDLDNSTSYSNTHVGFRCVTSATAAPQ